MRICSVGACPRKGFGSVGLYARNLKFLKGLHYEQIFGEERHYY